jgi:DNA invertase Pin-like site-specific DNA recombinase
VRIGYSRISDERQLGTDPLKQARHDLEKAGADLVLVEVGSGTDDASRPKFRQLREMVLSGQATEVITPNQDRLGRNLALVLDFVQLCHLQGVALRDLNGRELEVKTADGRLMTTLLGALDQHRSQLYGEKTRRHLQSAREQGLPARPRVPFGLRKVRNEAGRFVGIEIDPDTGPMARQRVEWFLKEGLTITGLCTRINQQTPEHPMQMRQLARWLASPLLTGRLAWHKDATGRFKQVAAEQTFPALISDAEHEAINVRMEAMSTNQGVRGRTVRMFTGLARCGDCGKALAYKLSGRSTWYLRCCDLFCTNRNRLIRADLVFAVLQYSLSEHARHLLPILQQPAVDPPGVAALLAEIAVLEKITGTESVVEAKRGEINRLRRHDATTPGWLLIGALRSPSFWLQSDERLNNVLRQLLAGVTVQLGASVSAARVTSVRCRTSPAEAPLPPDQNDIRLVRGLADLELAAECQSQIEAALAAMA